MSGGSTRRLTEIDSLRGLAALMVVAFHFTTRYDEVYRIAAPIGVTVPWGYLGVYLFFVISGFVIFLTLDRTRTGSDFIVSRFSRLYPAYWSAIFLTFTITLLLGLPGRTVSWKIAIANFPMFQLLFRVPLVDGVYWTLMIELLFYVLAYAMFASGQLKRVLIVLYALLALHVVYWALATFARIDLPWRIRELLILDYIPFFGLGIIAFRLSREDASGRVPDLIAAIVAIVVVTVADSILLGFVAAACFGAVWLAASGKLGVLRFAPLVWLGSISYPLYLLHENIGWSVIRQLQLHAIGRVPATLIAAVLVIGLAAAVSKYIEHPAMAWIRRKYRESHLAPARPASG